MSTKKSLKIQPSFKKILKKLSQFLLARPFISVAVLFILLLILIVTGFVLRTKKQVEVTDILTPKAVEIFQIGQAPTIKVLAEVEKENVITIVVQKPGIVQKLYVEEGEHVNARGTTLAYIADNYQGGSVATLSRKMAQKQFENVRDTFDLQKNLLGKQKEIAQKTDENSDELREINAQSIDETKALISLNEEILSYVDRNLELYEASNSAQVNRDVIAGQKQLKSSFLAATNQLRSALRSTEYSVDSDNPPAQLSDLSREVTLKSLELQEKALELNREISQLQYQMAQVSEAVAYPSSISNGDIEKIHVRVGQYVSLGTPLITMSGCNKAVTATAYVSRQLAQGISLYQSATLKLGEQDFEQTPVFISSEAVRGLSYAVKFAIPEEYYDQVTDLEFIEIELPVAQANTSAIFPFVPIDSVYQSTSGSFIYLNEAGVARVRAVTLGEVYGQFVAVTIGLENADQVIVDRNVIDGDLVEVK